MGEFGPGDPAITTIFDGERATVRRLRKSKLVVVSGPDQGRELEVGKPRVSGGRSIINDLVLQDKAVSGTHFEVIVKDDGYRLRDLDSRNGTYVGELRVREVFLKPGTQFRLGHTEIRFQPLQDVVEIALSEKDRFDRVLGASASMREIFATLEKVAPSDLTVLITGETGTGKELVARGIHNASSRKAKPFVVLDCGAIPKDLIESTLFGHEKGSFTGAVGQFRGCFEQASGGTIFLDEIDDTPLSTQVKLLRVLEDGEVTRVGETRGHKVDFRIVAATNRDLLGLVAQGRFGDDLYQRLAIVHLVLPPLRARREDIGPLARHFVEAYYRRQPDATRAHVDTIAPEAIRALEAYDWPGNVRELANVLLVAATMVEGTVIGHPELAAAIGSSLTSRSPAGGDGAAAVKETSLAALRARHRAEVRELVGRAVAGADGNKRKAARSLGVSRQGLYRVLGS
jgi:DNA-binding NtrC family response regulator